MTTFDHITSEAAIEIYESAHGVFSALLKEVRELSKKKPDATLSSSKVTLVNNILNDLLGILKGEPEGKYLQPLADEELPQVSDALMMMVQFEAALASFRKRYCQYLSINGSREHVWVTAEIVQHWNDEGVRVSYR